MFIITVAICVTSVSVSVHVCMSTYIRACVHTCVCVVVYIGSSLHSYTGIYMYNYTS